MSSQVCIYQITLATTFNKKVIIIASLITNDDYSHHQEFITGRVCNSHIVSILTNWVE